MLVLAIPHRRLGSSYHWRLLPSAIRKLCTPTRRIRWLRPNRIYRMPIVQVYAIRCDIVFWSLGLATRRVHFGRNRPWRVSHRQDWAIVQWQHDSTGDTRAPPKSGSCAMCGSWEWAHAKAPFASLESPTQVEPWRRAGRNKIQETTRPSGNSNNRVTITLLSQWCRHLCYIVHYAENSKRILQYNHITHDIPRNSPRTFDLTTFGEQVCYWMRRWEWEQERASFTVVMLRVESLESKNRKCRCSMHSTVPVVVVWIWLCGKHSVHVEFTIILVLQYCWYSPTYGTGMMLETYSYCTYLYRLECTSSTRSVELSWICQTYCILYIYM